MPYTLAKFALWVAVAAAIGVWLGWMLRGVRRPPAVDERSETSATASPATPTDDETELARLRVRVGYLEPRAAEADELRRQLDERRAEAAAPADDTWPVDLPLRADALVAENERLSNLVASYQAENGELRARLWNSDAQVRDLQALLSEATRDAKLEE